MKTYLKYLSITGLVVSLALFGTACSSGGGGDDDDDGDGGTDETGGATGSDVTSITKLSGAYTPGITPITDSDGSLKWTITGVDVNGNGTVGVPSVTNTDAASGSCTDTDSCTSLMKGGIKATTDVDCDSRDVGSGDSADAFDIAISLDTTGSMGSAAGVIASKISEFAQDLEAAGVDAQFAGITVGDAYATKYGEGSTSFDDDVSTGDLGEPPDFDLCERPDTGAALIDADDMSTFFDEVETVVGSGCNGMGLPENYLGPIEFGNDNLEWRDGAARVMLSIGDDCAYTPETFTEDSIEGDWIPPDPDDLIDDLTTDGVVVHVVGGDEDFLACEDFDYFSMSQLADATGGSFTDIGDCSSADTCEVDLTELPITDSITSGTVNDCATTCDLFESLGFSGGTVTITITFFLDINMLDDGENFAASFAVVMSMTIEC
ncbi:MAG: hypothetical protein HYU99_03900 [Deltaproteobacteria bacterium]|nr:hypothetical protein [Deltaproteobacteria bacterium]